MKKSLGEKLAGCFIHSALILFSLSTVLPFILTFMVSISDEKSVVENGYRLIPQEFSLEAYKTIFTGKVVLNSYLVTVFVTAVGTFLAVLICAMLGYSISAGRVKHRNKIALFLFIPMVFNAGLVPWYLVVTKYLHLKNNIWALIIPILISPYNVFLIRNFFKSLPASMAESAEIDGAGIFYTFAKIMLPLSTPIIATVSLFVSLSYWNDWALALWLIDKKELYPLQYMLYRIQSLINYMTSGGGQSVGGSAFIPRQTVQMATLLVTIGPIILLYPFVQKYFIKGIMVGAIKG